MAEPIGVEANSDDNWKGEKLERPTIDDIGDEEPMVPIDEACETSLSEPM